MRGGQLITLVKNLNMYIQNKQKNMDMGKMVCTLFVFIIMILLLKGYCI